MFILEVNVMSQSFLSEGERSNYDRLMDVQKNGDSQSDTNIRKVQSGT